MQKKVLRNILGLFLVATLLIAIVGCGTKTTSTAISSTTSAQTTTNTTAVTTTTSMTTTSTTTTTTAAPAAATHAGLPYTPYTGNFDRTFTFYDITPLSGASASYGIQSKRALDWAVQDTNAQGGLMVGGVRYKLVGTVIDDAYDTTKAVSIAQQVVNQSGKYLAIMGTGINMATEDYFAQNNVLVEAQALASPLVCGTQWPLQFIDNLFPADMGMICYYPYFHDKMGVNTICIADPDTDTGHVFSNMAVDAIKKNSIPIQVVDQEFFKSGTQDFSPMVNKIMKINPDMIDLGSSGSGDYGLFMKQVREAGYKGILYCGVGQDDAATIWQVAGADSTGAYNMGFYGADPTPAYTAYSKIYQQTFNETMSSLATFYYEHPYILFQAINQANSFDPYKVANILENMQWNVLYGPSQYVAGAFGIKRCTSFPTPLIKYTTNGHADTVITVPYPGS